MVSQRIEKKRQRQRAGRLYRYDFTEPQRNALARLAQSDGWEPITGIHSGTIARLSMFDLIMVDESDIDETRVKVTSRGMAFYREHIRDYSPKKRSHVDKYDDVIALAISGKTYTEVAEIIGMTATGVGQVMRGKTKAARKALRRAGIKPGLRTPRIPDWKRAKAIRMRRAGMSYEVICDTLEVSQGTVGGWMKEADLVTKPHLTEDQRREIVHWIVNEGLTQGEAMERIGRSKRVVLDTMRAYYRGALTV